jgi:ABC-type multidrug transport system ATPase subunit
MFYISAVYRPLEAIGTTVGNLQQQVVPLRLGFQVLDTEPDIDDAPDAAELERVEGRVTLDGCSFSYEGRERTLDHISFEAQPGDVIAIVGPTGAGKSTVVSLIPRFVDPDEGRVLVDGHDVRTVTQASLRAHIAVVLQDPLLFSGSIMDNIRYGRLDATDDDVVAAARAANAHDFISGLPNGYQTLLGERGARLSGGERQRISIARAFLRDAPILILDEPTSSVDSKTEQVILDSLDELMRGRTTFMIAHRLGTVRKATKILVMDGGEIIQRGTHAELMASEGLYRRLHDAQTGQVSVDADAPVPQSRKSKRVITRKEGDQLPPIAWPPSRQPAPSQQNGHGDAPHVRGQRTIVLLGMMTKIPVAGVVWQTLHYMKGFELLGFTPYYVEAHARTPSMFMERPEDDGSAGAADFIASVMRAHGFADQWAYHARHAGDQHFGLSADELQRLYRSAELIVNLHGGTVPTEEHSAPGRLVYLETDPGNIQVEIDAGDQEAIDYVDAHQFHFTFAENLGQPDCGLPAMGGRIFKPTRQPVVHGWWADHGLPPSERYTTIGNWRQQWRQVELRGEVYHWSKHLEFLKVVDLPRLAPAEFELALASYDEADREMLEGHGWAVTPSLDFSMDLNRYRDYIQRSRGEFTVAKDQNVRLRSGWFSDRSATYLAAGRPVVTQDTGFGRVLPTGEGLFTFSTVDEAAAAIEEIERAYARHAAAAAEIGRAHFGAMGVLGRLLDDIGVDRTAAPAGAGRQP